jgi:hypothetical protein
VYASNFDSLDYTIKERRRRRRRKKMREMVERQSNGNMYTLVLGIHRYINTLSISSGGVCMCANGPGSFVL